jgi:hypothetical protein
VYRKGSGLRSKEFNGGIARLDFRSKPEPCRCVIQDETFIGPLKGKVGYTQLILRTDEPPVTFEPGSWSVLSARTLEILISSARTMINLMAFSMNTMDLRLARETKYRAYAVTPVGLPDVFRRRRGYC